MLELAVVVPTFNERENVIELTRRLERVLHGIGYEVIVVDDDSPDGTASTARELARADSRVRVLHRVGRRGLSSACIEGMMATAAPYVAVIDADLQHDEALLPRMLEKLKSEQLDLVVGTRHAEGGSSAGLTSWRLPLSNAGKKLSRLVSRTELSDPMSGYFVVDRRFLEEVVRSLSGRGFKILLDLVASSRRPVRIGEVPYHFRARLHGDSKLDVLVGLEYLQLLVDKLIGDWIPPRFVLFGLVGGSGVVLHLLVLGMLLAARLTFWQAQLAATVLVMTSNFFLNNMLTWRDHRLRGGAAFVGLLKFYAACAIGAFLNLQVATFAIEHGVPWYVAGFGGLVVGSIWNFAVTATTTWKRRRAAR
ncbi:MAG TPA: glycosyltransferase family 2 protein [Thermoanaerobaculia bacterium]